MKVNSWEGRDLHAVASLYWMKDGALATAELYAVVKVSLRTSLEVVSTGKVLGNFLAGQG